jgi:hypothetical protein
MVVPFPVTRFQKPGNARGLFHDDRRVEGDRPRLRPNFDLREVDGVGHVPVDLEEPLPGGCTRGRQSTLSRSSWRRLSSGPGESRPALSYPVSHVRRRGRAEKSGCGRPERRQRTRCGRGPRRLVRFGASRQRGRGTFRAKTDYGVGYEPRSVALGDLNGDGWSDLPPRTTSRVPPRCCSMPARRFPPGSRRRRTRPAPWPKEERHWSDDPARQESGSEGRSLGSEDWNGDV